MKLVLTVFAALIALVSVNVSFADDQIPPCLSYGKDLADNSQQVLHWKRTTSNQFQERGHVTGVVTQLFPDRNGHTHFEINIGHNPQDTLEVIYNTEFGAIPSPQIGMRVEACGDYITSTAQSGPYPASPDGAIIHWVHKNPSGKGHDSGYLALDGKLYGQDAENAGPKHGGNNRPPRHGRHDFSESLLAN